MNSINRGIPIVAALLAALSIPAAGAAQEAPRGTRGEATVRVQNRGWFGFAFTPLPAEAGRGQRVVVQRVEPNSGAARGGLQQGDTIVRWAGRADVVAALSEGRFAPEQSVRLRARRNGRERDLTLVAGTRPHAMIHRSEDGRVIVVDPSGVERQLRVLSDSTFPRLDSLGIHVDSLQRRLRVMLRDSLGPQLRELERLPPMSFEFRGDSIRAVGPMLAEIQAGLRGVAGAEFADLNPELATYFSADRGVLVLRVAPDTPAARAGLQAGDVVRRANGREVTRVAELRSAIARASGRSVELEVVRRGNPRNVRMSWD